MRFFRRSSIAIAAAAALSAGGPAFAQSVCTGDCDESAEVSVDELIAGVGDLLAGSVAACPAFDADASGDVTVDEIVRSLGLAVSGCAEVLGEAAAGVAASIADASRAEDIIDFGLVIGEPGGGSGSGQGTQPVCAFGGNVTRSCTVSGATATFVASYRNCRNYDPLTDHNILRNGDLRLAVASPNACTSPVVPPPATSYIYEAKAFVEMVTTPLNRVVERAEQALRIDFTANGLACAGTNGSARWDGTLALFRQSPLSLRPDTEQRFDYRLERVIDSRDRPCAIHDRRSGELAVADRVKGRSFVTVAEDFEITRYLDPSNRAEVFAQQGRLDVDCFGPLRIETRAPLLLDDVVSCPVGGILDLTFANGQTARTLFTARGGIELDLDLDGRPERTAPTCLDESVARCARAPREEASPTSTPARRFPLP